MLRLNSILLIACALLASQQSELLYGQKASNDKGPAFTEPPLDDPSYALMGEFVGTVKSDDKKSTYLGLQIRTMGQEQFEAIAYHGGLPGQKKHQTDPIRMIGKRSGDFVVLSGGPWAIFVEKNSCRVVDRQGNKVGQLKRINRKSPTMYAKPPEGATILFNGTDTNQFVKAEMTADGLLMEGADVKPMFQDFNLHVEFRLPYMPFADGQKRANSGLYLQNRYECQVLDSFAQTPEIDGCGALYRFKPADLSMCFPPLVWQTYDVQFTAPRWSADGNKIRDAHVTSWINGVKVQDNVALKNKTGAGKPEGAFLSPMRFQDHGDPVRFRNIWVVDRGLINSEFPVIPSRSEIQAAIKLEQQKKKQRAKAARKRAAMKKKAAAQKEKAAEQKAERLEESQQTPGETSLDKASSESEPKTESRDRPNSKPPSEKEKKKTNTPAK